MAQLPRKSSAENFEEVSPELIFGPAPILRGENSKAYDELLGRISAQVKPSDIFEEIWTREIVNYTWELLRLHRLKTSLLSSYVAESLAKALAPPANSILDLESNLLGEPRTIILAKKWAARDPSAIKEIASILQSSGITEEMVLARALELVLDKIERVDRMMAAIETRRNAILREIPRHREAFSRNIRRASNQEIEDAVFETVSEKTIGSK